MAEKINTILKEKLRCEILESLKKKELSFSEILEKVNLRDHGQLNYHLGLLSEAGLLEKTEGKYKLSELGEKMAHYTQQFMLKEMYPLSVVCVIVKDKEGNVLITRRAKKPYQGHWVFPGGKVRVGETLKEAAEREILEETGLKIRFEKVSGIYPTIVHNKNEINFHANLVSVVASVSERNPAIVLDDSMDKHQFVKISELGEYQFIPTNLDMIKDIGKKDFSFKELSIKQD